MGTHKSDTQLGIFCLVGALATFCVGYLLAALAKNICRAQSKLLRAIIVPGMEEAYESTSN